MRSRMAALLPSPARSSRSRISGVTSSPRASSTSGTTARRARRSCAVAAAASHSPSCAGSAPYPLPSATSRSDNSPKCAASSAATSTQSSKNACGRPASANRATRSQARSIAFSSICASACSSATRPAGEPKLRRFGMSRGGSSSGRAGRAGRVGGAARPTATPPSRQRAATSRLSATFVAGSTAQSTATAPSARDRVIRGGPACVGGSETLHRFQDFRDVAWHLYLAPGTAHGAVLVDQEGAAVDAHVFAAVHAFLDPDAVILGHLALGIRGEDERQAVLLLELVVRGDRVARDADHDRAGLAVVGERIAKTAGPRGAPRGVVL